MADEGTTRGVGPGPAQGVYGISVAAGLTDMDPQSLRLYEKRGLLQPSRSPGGTRLYSDDDLARLRRIAALLAAGVNLSGAGRVLELEDDNQRLETVNARLRAENRRLRRGSATVRAGDDPSRTAGDDRGGAG